MNSNKGKKKAALDMSSAIEPVREVKGKMFWNLVYDAYMECIQL